MNLKKHFGAACFFDIFKRAIVPLCMALTLASPSLLYTRSLPLAIALTLEQCAASAIRVIPAAIPVPEPTAEISGGVSVIGDSVPLGAKTALENTLSDAYVDASVSRSLKAGVDIITDLQDKGELREYVVIALGTNGTNNYAKLYTQIIEALNPGHRLVIVTPFDGRLNENAKVTDKTAKWIRELPLSYDFITVADWNSLITSQSNLLAKDKVHMGGKTSIKLYADCVAEAVKSASLKPAKQ